MSFRRLLPLRASQAGALALAAALAASPVSAADNALRVCADPDNLPFSSNAQGKDQGMYVELAELVAKKLGQPIDYVWWSTHYQRRAMRNTIQKDECDAMFALPATTDWRARGVQKSAPFLDVSYVVVAKPGTTITGLDSLKGKRIAVQFSTTPHIVFANLGGFDTATYKDPEEVFAALAKGDAEVALMWGPIAGYDNKHKQANRWQLTPVTGMELSGQVVVGVRAGAEGLKARIDQALADLKPEIEQLAAKYGFPTQRAVSFEPRSKPTSAVATSPHQALSVPASGWSHVADEKKKPASPAKKAAAATGAAAAAGTAATAAAAPAAPADPLITAGRTRFNDQCSHCHGADGASPIRERDVRRLSMRYDADKWRNVAETTIKNGRSDLGMPPWKDALNEQNVKELIAFLATIQK